MIPTQQHDNNNNTNNGMYDNIIKQWKEIEYTKEEEKHSIDTNNNIDDDDDDDNDKYIRVKISCDFSKRDHLKYTNKNDDHQSRNNNKKKYNNNNNMCILYRCGLGCKKPLLCSSKNNIILFNNK